MYSSNQSANVIAREGVSLARNRADAVTRVSRTRSRSVGPVTGNASLVSGGQICTTSLLLPPLSTPGGRRCCISGEKNPKGGEQQRPVAMKCNSNRTGTGRCSKQRPARKKDTLESVCLSDSYYIKYTLIHVNSINSVHGLLFLHNL